MRVYPAVIALAGLSPEEREAFGIDADPATLYRPTCGRCQHPMALEELSAHVCAVCGAPAHFAFGPRDKDGMTVADFPDTRIAR